MVTTQAYDQNGEHVSISEEDLAILVATRNGAAYVLDLLARSARPGRGAAPLLRALGAMARIAVEALAAGRPHWFFGTLTVEVLAHANAHVNGRNAGATGITVDVMTDHGGPREALFERTYFAIPLEELRWMLERIPELAAPLRVRAQSSGTMRTGFSGKNTGMTLYVPPQPLSMLRDGDRHADRHAGKVSADDTAKIVVSPESLFDPDSTAPVPALMAEMAHLSIPSNVDPLEL